MRIAFLNDDWEQSSVSRIVADLAGTLRALQHDVHVITTHRREESPDTRREEGRTSIPVSYRKSLRHYRLSSASVQAVLRVELDHLRPDVIHAHNVHQYLTYGALRAARALTPHVFLTLHDVMSFSYGRLATKRYLASGGSDPQTTFRDHIRQAGLQWNPLRNFLIRRAIDQNVRTIFAVSGALKRALDAHGIPRVTVLHNAMDLRHWRYDPDAVEAIRERYGLRNRKVILFGGRLSRDKGSTPLLHALARIRRSIPSVLLLVLGEEERWRGLVHEANVPEDLSRHMRCTGWLSLEEMRSAFAACDVVTTPSLCLDTFNLLNLEAMAANKPVVGTIFGGTPEVVEDSVTGFIRNPLHSEGYAEALALLLRDEALARRMGEAGRKRAEEQFSLEKQVERLLEFYKRS